ncbi:MAG: alanine--tRNA ligase [Coprobacillus sp.]|nr:alanine--tRNA ligase [Coprobacillus sp.]
MKYLSGNEIRNLWLKFFSEKGHKVEPGASLIPVGDPTLLWINSGVAALKKYFDGREIPPSRRICNVQKAIRTNDIENVGHTAKHHTFFEMLGNFSIGDYFRKEAIEYAVEILTSPDYYAMPIDKLYITYFPTDLEAKKYWMENGISESHLIPLEHNYWEIGEGPCGPNTEVFFDRGDKYDPEHKGLELLIDEVENDRYVEIWGIVFSQYNAVAGQSREEYKELPSKNIDTGAGLERITCVLQETDTNFETDLFYPIIKATEKMATVNHEDNLTAYRVIADHIRAITFALSDGESFSNEGRGYVLRRLLRRALRYGKDIGIAHPFLNELVDIVYAIYKDFYPYLIEKLSFIKKVILSEEEKFLLTLENGETLLNKLIEENHKLTGLDIFKLYDTYGFPKELSLEICEERGVEVDIAGFDEAMKKQQETARKARGEYQSMSGQAKDLLECKAESTFNYTKTSLVKSEVVALFNLKGEKVDEINEEGMVIFKETNFYAEMGGQIADIGQIISRRCAADVYNVKHAPNGQNLHYIKVLYGSVHLGDKFTLKIDETRRMRITANHSATHLLDAALAEVLGEHVAQAGSYVSDEYLTFDFTHYQKMSEEEIMLVEEKVNQWISEAIPEKTLVLPIEEAKKLGARMLFGDKYGDIVRVVTFGDVSKEFCGGTHVANSSEIGSFIIESEESIAAGVRRITARSSIGAYHLSKNRKNTLNQVSSKLGASSTSEILPRLNTLVSERDALKKSVEELNNQIGASIAVSLLKDIPLEPYPVLVSYLKGTSRETLMHVADYIRSHYNSYLLFLVGENSKGDYPVISFIKGKALESGNNAGELLRFGSSYLNGKGGGKTDSASGTYSDISSIDFVLTKIKEELVK